MFTQLGRIAEMADEGAENAERIGALTTAPRTDWAKAREDLVKGIHQDSHMEMLRQCLISEL